MKRSHPDAAATISDGTHLLNSEYVAYPSRWFMLFLYFCMASHSSSQWICMSAIVQVATDYYQTATWVTYLSILVFDLVSPISFLGSWFISRYGFQSSIWIAAAGTLIGGWVKVIWPTVWGQIGGQVIIAVAHVFSSVSMPVYSALWHPTSERALSTSILFFSTVLGGGVGFVLAPTIVGTDPQMVPRFYLLQAILGTAFCLPCAFIRRKPPTPPSRSSAMAENLPTKSYLGDLRVLASNGQFLLLLLGFSLGFAILNTVAITAADIFKAFTPMQVGIIGSGTVFAGMVGCIVLSILVDYTDLHKQLLALVNIVAGVAMLLLYFAMRNGNFYIIASCVFFAGMFGISGTPVAYEMACEVTFPVHEAVTTGLMTVVAQFMSIGLTGLEVAVVADKVLAPLLASFLYIFVVFFLVSFNGIMKRRAIDRQEGDFLS